MFPPPGRIRINPKDKLRITFLYLNNKFKLGNFQERLRKIFNVEGMDRKKIHVQNFKSWACKS